MQAIPKFVVPLISL